MQPRSLVLLPLALLAACAFPDLPSFSDGGFIPWSSLYDAARDERNVADIAADKLISTRIKAALVDQDRALGLKVKVYCYLRQVTLLGQVADDQFKVLAVATAWEVEGVRGVATHWEAPGRADTAGADLEIAARLRAALVADENLSATQIEAEVFGGKVYLVGMVRSAQDADRAVARAEAVQGVTGVVSLLVPSAQN